MGLGGNVNTENGQEKIIENSPVRSDQLSSSFNQADQGDELYAQHPVQSPQIDYIPTKAMLKCLEIFWTDFFFLSTASFQQKEEIFQKYIH